MFVFFIVALLAILSLLPGHWVVDLLLPVLGVVAALLTALVTCVILVVIGAIQRFFGRA